jgi:hypothetical protein
LSAHEAMTSISTEAAHGCPAVQDKIGHQRVEGTDEKKSEPACSGRVACNASPHSARSLGSNSHSQSHAQTTRSRSSRKPPSGAAYPRSSTNHVPAREVLDNNTNARAGDQMRNDIPIACANVQSHASPTSCNREQLTSGASSSSSEGGHEMHLSRKPARSLSPLRDTFSNTGRHWRVTGGVGKGGIIVREGCDLCSAVCSERLSTGALVEEEEVVGERLRFSKLSGRGPDTGWVSISLKDKRLLVHVDASELNVPPVLLPSARSDASIASAPPSSYRSIVAATATDDAPRSRRASEHSRRLSADQASRRGHSCDSPSASPHPQTMISDKLPRINLSRSAPPALAKTRHSGAAACQLPQIAVKMIRCKYNG